MAWLARSVASAARFVPRAAYAAAVPIRRPAFSAVRMMSTDLKGRFDHVCATAGPKIQASGTNAQKLTAYSLFKQATVGDVAGDRPGALEFIARAKYDAWAKLKGVSKEKAMQQYIDEFGEDEAKAAAAAKAAGYDATDVAPTAPGKFTPKGAFATIRKTPMLPPGGCSGDGGGRRATPRRAVAAGGGGLLQLTRDVTTAARHHRLARRHPSRLASAGTFAGKVAFVTGGGTGALEQAVAGPVLSCGAQLACLPQLYCRRCCWCPRRYRAPQASARLWLRPSRPSVRRSPSHPASRTCWTPPPRRSLARRGTR